MERIGIVLMLLFFPVLIISTVVVYGHDDHKSEYDDSENGYEERSEEEMEEYLDPRRQGRLRSFRPAVVPARNQVYIANCSECHLAYSPNLLPARSWEKMMTVNELQDHFGEYLDLEAGDRRMVLNYLVKNAADKVNSQLARKIASSVPAGEAPLQINRLKPIANKHDGIPDKYTIFNSKVRSLSQCSACHQQVDKGIYEEDDVFIPYQPLRQPLGK